MSACQSQASSCASNGPATSAPPVMVLPEGVDPINISDSVVDAMSLQYLTGAEIDYEDKLDGARFVIRNPNASSTCGCGSSFNV